ncbi:MAG: hypothetical protein EPN93_12275 [Spirochaetes bacterium]|nr:MAG: hypothetical protein EPN93_12275 [Spirochaetota bacterium]
MKRISMTLIMLFACCAALAATGIPTLVSRVTDTASMFSSAARWQAERILEEHERKTTNQVAVLTIPTLGGEVLEQYSIRVVEKWKLGKKGKDNGVLLLFVRNDRKVRIEVGYGLEGVLTDAMSGRIINDIITVHFRQEHYDEGLIQSVNAIIAVIAGEFKAGDEGKYAPQPTFGQRVKHYFFRGLQYTLIGIGILVGLFLAGTIIWMIFQPAFLLHGAGGWVGFGILGPVFMFLGFLPFLVNADSVEASGISVLLFLFPPVALFTAIKLLFAFTRRGQRLAKKLWVNFGEGGSGSSSSYSISSSYSSSSSSSSSSDSYSGGGGSFGGGGASGSW